MGTEQILLGLIGESTGIAAKVLKSMGVNLKDTRVEVEKIIGRGSGFVAVEIPFTPRAKRVLELSLEEARQLGGSRLRLHLYALSHASCSHASCNKAEGRAVVKTSDSKNLEPSQATTTSAQSTFCWVCCGRVMASPRACWRRWVCR